MSSDHIEQINISIIGRVQAVFYRAMVEKVAESMHLKGYIENTREGNVEIVAQGERQKLEELLRWCQRGNFLSKIEGMSYKYSPVEAALPDFYEKIEGGIIADRINAARNLGRRVKKRLTGVVEAPAIPKHVVIIPDGNRRWAREKGWKPWVGHQQASRSEHLMSLVNEARKIGVKYLTFWAMSTDNWKRDQEEVNVLFNILKEGIGKFSDGAKKEGIRFLHIGRKDRLPKELVETIDKLEKATAHFTEMSVQIALDYGGRDELVRAVNKIYNNKDLEQITADTIREHIDSIAEIPDPDLIIRTAGEKRSSGALLWQSDYAEFYFTDIYFPDFGPEHVRLAILEYSYRVRRFGGTAGSDIPDKKLREPKKDELEKYSYKAEANTVG